MDYTLKKAEAKKADPIYFNIYQMLGGYAWGYFCEHCKHEFKVSKKYPSGRCIVCGKIRYPNEN
jgi:hypothetical protein